MLSYDDGIELEWGMRAEKPVKTALTEQYRSRGQLAAFVAGAHVSGQAAFDALVKEAETDYEGYWARLARELHDGIGQTLVSTKLLVEAGADSRDPGPLAKALQGLNHTLVEVRRISHRLRPALLDTLGLPHVKSADVQTLDSIDFIPQIQAVGVAYAAAHVKTAEHLRGFL